MPRWDWTCDALLVLAIVAAGITALILSIN